MLHGWLILISGYFYVCRDDKAPQFIVDRTVQKPADWLEEEEPFIPDPEAEVPDDWYVNRFLRPSQWGPRWDPEALNNTQTAPNLFISFI